MVGGALAPFIVARRRRYVGDDGGAVEYRTRVGTAANPIEETEEFTSGWQTLALDELLAPGPLVCTLAVEEGRERPGIEFGTPA